MELSKERYNALIDVAEVSAVWLKFVYDNQITPEALPLTYTHLGLIKSAYEACQRVFEKETGRKVGT